MEKLFCTHNIQKWAQRVFKKKVKEKIENRGKQEIEGRK